MCRLDLYLSEGMPPERMIWPALSTAIAFAIFLFVTSRLPAVVLRR
jgi:lipopolysaccharide export LptBFGC system permease protein LptF